MNDDRFPADEPTRAPTEALPAPRPPDDPARVWTSGELLSGTNEALIRHGQEVYRLRLTRNGKLILHK